MEGTASKVGMSDAERRRFIESTWPHNALDDPRVKRWRAAGQLTLVALLSYLSIQYYFFDVYLTIMAMPRVTVLAALP